MDYSELRKSKNLTQQQVASKLNISVKTYQRIEKSPDRISQALHKQLLSILGVDELSTTITKKSATIEQLSNHISEKEIEILEAFRSLPKERQEAFYYKIKYEAIEYGEQNALKAV